MLLSNGEGVADVGVILIGALPGLWLLSVWATNGWVGIEKRQPHLRPAAKQRMVAEPRALDNGTDETP